jgi:hypothetical protein
MEGIETLGVENFENFLKKFASSIGPESLMAKRFELVYLYMKWTKEVEFTQRDLISWVNGNIEAGYMCSHQNYIGDLEVDAYVGSHIGIFYRNRLLLKKHPDLYTVTTLH